MDQIVPAPQHEKTLVFEHTMKLILLLMFSGSDHRILLGQTHNGRLCKVQQQRLRVLYKLPVSVLITAAAAVGPPLCSHLLEREF